LESSIDLKEVHIERMVRHMFLEFTEALRANRPAYEAFKEQVLPLARASTASVELPLQTNNTGSPKCPHYQPLANCVWQGVGSNNGITCSDSGPCVWTLRASA